MDSAKEHFELEELVDYVRQTGPPDRLRVMEAHLVSDGCERCGRLAEMLSNAYGAARELEAVEVPESAVRMAKALFEPRPASRWLDLPAVLAARLTGPIPQLAGAGWRSEGARAGALYNAGAVRVMVFDEADAEGRRSIAGWIFDENGGLYPNCPVALLRGQSVLAEGRSSQFGEFHFTAAEIGKTLRLSILTHTSEERIEIDIGAI